MHTINTVFPFLFLNIVFSYPIEFLSTGGSSKQGSMIDLSAVPVTYEAYVTVSRRHLQHIGWKDVSNSNGCAQM